MDGDTTLAEFVDEGSWLLFQLLNMSPSEWLSKPCSEWHNDMCYQRFRDFVRSLKVCNDVAERGIAMIQTYASATKVDEKLQCLLQEVEEHRRKMPSFNKKSLSSM